MQKKKKKNRLYNLQILQTGIREKNCQKEKKGKKKKKKKAKLKRNKVLNIQDRANIIIIPTWPQASLPRFHQTALQDCSGEVG